MHLIQLKDFLNANSTLFLLPHFRSFWFIKICASKYAFLTGPQEILMFLVWEQWILKKILFIWTHTHSFYLASCWSTLQMSTMRWGWNQSEAMSSLSLSFEWPLAHVLSKAHYRDMKWKWNSWNSRALMLGINITGCSSTPPQQPQPLRTIFWELHRVFFLCCCSLDDHDYFLPPSPMRLLKALLSLPLSFCQAFCAVNLALKISKCLDVKFTEKCQALRSYPLESCLFL